MNLLIVNYHYVTAEERFSYPGIHPISPERFRRELVTLQKKFTFIGQTELLAAIRGERDVPPYACLVTFDDGLRSQYDEALPILRDLRIPAVFFVSGLPLVRGVVLSIHKLHWSRAHTAPDVFLEKVKRTYDRVTGKRFEDLPASFTEEDLRRHYCYDSSLDVAAVKYILGRDVLSTDVRTSIIDTIFKEIVSDEAAFAKKFYMTADELRTLHASGFALGIHTFSHLAGPELVSPVVAEREVGDCKEVLSKIVGDHSSIAGISYPYGDIVPAVIEAAEHDGLHYGVTLDISMNDQLLNPFLLSRVDANDVPEGKVPKFSLEKGEIKVTDPVFTLKRTRYAKMPEGGFSHR